MKLPQEEVSKSPIGQLMFLLL